ncbi:ANTAR domain-containing protein [Psychrosphaera sp. B3R10]|uniref:ANTAR domain-containing response regulator n=1 Tax=unclassified Psychrosphaera TaxID=2641570 RepID=UPI001C097696|nr:MULTISPECIES: ANTAR domain-containing protein [unclassified Psychrosphaera]MBU2882027.1 ANTAR domain-containing protein [Psychrosphaera sp. I2R16]MBU2989842.1 ANTAR domain-containing protein [Psychrosphaera sp. B3R10]
MATKNKTTNTLTVLVIDDDMERAESFRAALAGSPYVVKHLAHTSASLLREVENTEPDIILIDIESPNRDTIESLSTISEFNPKPIVMFSEKDQPDLMRDSIKAGVSAYVSGETNPDRAKFILDVAVARFNEFQGLKAELTDAKRKLQSRKWVDQAKALLIEKQGMSEQQAYSAIRKMAMDNGQKMEDVAKNLISMMQLIGGGK